MFSRRCLLLSTCFVVFLFAYAASVSNESDRKKTAFVDRDGDGINDNNPDINGNGIPDLIESGNEKKEPVQSLLGDVFNSAKMLEDIGDLRSNSDKFGSLSFKTRALTQRCRGFGSEQDEFGPGGGIGSMTGGCVGGACLR